MHGLSGRAFQRGPFAPQGHDLRGQCSAQYILASPSYIMT
jgi:hypothetical protein